MSEAPSSGLTAGGWLFLLLAWGLIVALTLFCFRKLLKTRDRKKS